jgi:hypothetical protein
VHCRRSRGNPTRSLPSLALRVTSRGDVTRTSPDREP